MVDGDELEVEGSKLLARTLAHRERIRLNAVFLELGLNESEREGGTHERDVGTQAQEVGHRTNVVFVPVRENHGQHVIETLADGREVGKD